MKYVVKVNGEKIDDFFTVYEAWSAYAHAVKALTVAHIASVISLEGDGVTASTSVSAGANPF